MRLTGWLRGQTDNAVAPAGFEFSNGWKVRHMLSNSAGRRGTNAIAAREENHLA